MAISLVPPVRNPVNADVVQRLEHALAVAKLGGVDNVAICWTNEDDASVNNYSAQNGVLLLGAVTMLQARLIGAIE